MTKPSPQKLEDITGLTSNYAQKLRDVGINTPLDLMRKAATSTGLHELALSTEVSETLIKRWIADLRPPSFD